MNHFDVIIIGTGAGGGTLAWALAGTGKTILLLERGDYLRREKENWDPKAVFEDQRYVTHERWHNGEGKAFRPEMHYYVGGQTKVYGAALLRLRSEDFGELRHRDSISPAWPLASVPFPFPALPHEPRIAEIVEGFRRIGLRPCPPHGRYGHSDLLPGEAPLFVLQRRPLHGRQDGRTGGGVGRGPCVSRRGGLPSRTAPAVSEQSGRG